jgi:CDP-glucose 4,6-dehydratase
MARLEVNGKAMVDNNFWKNRKVFLTGHTGFKGSWLCLWLHSLGAAVSGYALKPPTDPSLYELCKIEQCVHSTIADVRDGRVLTQAMQDADPEIVIHMAAQPLVRESYKSPQDTYSINIMGTVNLLEAVRSCKNVRAVINVTTDKCYESREWIWGYRENDALGGFDPYSSSKACSELVTAAYRSSYFHLKAYSEYGVAIASARAGNVIGGGDWAADRLIPDCIRALLRGEQIVVRNPEAIRPWQHVLEPLSGYILLAQKLIQGGASYAEAWNFGPAENDARTVEWIVKKLCEAWGAEQGYRIDRGGHPHESLTLKLDCSKARSLLGWHPRWSVDQAIDSIAAWTRAYRERKDLTSICLSQIETYSYYDEGR